ncbi:MAG: DUF2194 domain-containing protein [Spirochaetales bacterium]|nr:DUF2194 domain-containing protein [Spirochaetales bacterium]
MIILVLSLYLFTACDQLTGNSLSSNSTGTPDVSNISNEFLSHPAGKVYRFGRIDNSIRLFGNKILALYKSSDKQSDKENEIFFYLSVILQKMGFVMEYWDIDSGIPDSFTVKNVRAVISWYRSSSMADPDSYLDFMDRMIKSGRKFLVIDNLGAWQYRNRKEEDSYVDPARVNLTLSKLGLWYLGDWTNDGNLIEIASKVPEIVEKGGPQNAQISSFYYTFFPVDREMDVYLSIKRKDMNIDPSPVIVTNRSGGFVFSQYIYRQENGKVNVLIDFEKYLKLALFGQPKGQKVLLLTNSNEPYSKKITTMTHELLKRSKIKHDIIESEWFEFLLSGELNSYKTIVLILSNDQKLKPEIFQDYLANGGSICTLLPLYSQSLPKLFNSEFVQINQKEEKEGYRIKMGFTLGENLELVQNNFYWKPGYFKPNANNTILAVSLDDGYPMLWSGNNGKGKYIIWNWDGFLGAENMGLIVESILSLLPIGVSSSLGSAHMFIDDWPLPMYNIEKDQLPPEMTDTQFYTQIWWPDIKDLFAKYKIPYSSYLVFNYNAVVEPPFTGGEFFVAENNMSYNIAMEILNNNIEMGYHGYNHMSLTRDKTEVNINAWPSVTAMEASLREGARVWKNLFGEGTLPFAYVAVNNIISEEGVAAIKNEFPSIKIISALRWGVEEETYTTIGPHPIMPETYYLPRITFGYQISNSTRTLMASGVSGPGLISHFIHPDDVFDPFRSKGKSWKALLAEFENIIQFQQKHYPWMTWLSIRDIYHRLIAQDDSLLNIRYDQDRILIEGTVGQLLRIRTNGKSVKALNGLDILYEYKNHPTLIAKIKSIFSEIRY